MREGAERRKGASVTNWHLMEVPRAVVTRHARLPALHCGDFGPCHRTSSSDRSGVTTQRDPDSIGAALHPTSPSHSRRPPQRGRTMTEPPGTSLRGSPAGAAPCSANMTPHESALSRARHCGCTVWAKEKKGNSNWSVNSLGKEGTRELSRRINALRRHHRAGARRRDR